MADEDRTVQVPAEARVRAWLRAREGLDGDVERVRPIVVTNGVPLYASDLAALLSQPPVSLPTREQVAKAAYYAEKRADYGDSWGERWEDESEGYQATYLAIADDVLALLSQPIPTATSGYCPDCGNYGRAHGRVQDVADGPMRDCRYKGVDLRPADPPRLTTDEDVAEAQALLDQVVRESGVESMAPGTRLRADRLVNRDEWEWDGHNLRRLRDGLLQGPEDIDPSTIRDVTPPKETP